MSWTIYCHVHIESQRRYVGLTKQTMERRWAMHVSKAKSSKGGRWHFPNAIRKYGPTAFEHFILEVCETLEEANAAEKRWIEHFNTRNPLFGFNLAEGGKHEPHPIRKNPWDDPEYRAKQASIPKQWKSPEAIVKHKQVVGSDAYRAKRSVVSREIHSRPEVKAKLSAAGAKSKPGPNFTFKGKRHSVETIEKLRMLNTGNTHSVGCSPSPETRVKLSKIMTGRKHTDEARKKMADANPKQYQTIDGVVVNKLCKVHGQLEPGQFYVSIRKNGCLNVVCKVCARENERRCRDRARTKSGGGTT